MSVDIEPRSVADAPPPTEESTGWTGLVVVAGLVIVLGAFGGFSALVVVAAIIIMIFLHELGHFVAARRGGMKATEFFIGFGPRIWSFRRGETEYGLKAIPAGAYVRIIGMTNLEEVEPADEPRTYRQATFPRRLLVAVAGSAMHFLIALVLLFVLFAGPGFRGFFSSNEEIDAVVLDSADWEIALTVEGSLAESAGLELGDRIVAVDGVETPTFNDMRAIISSIEPGTFVELDVVRGGERIQVAGALGENDDGGGFLGISPGLPDSSPVDPLTAVGRSVSEFGSLSVDSVTQLGSFFTPSGLSDFFGLVVGADNEPVVVETDPSDADSENEGRILSIYGAARIGSAVTDQGAAQLLQFLVVLNVFIGIFNLAPLLPLDGGHVAIAVYERLRERRGERYHADVGKLLPLTVAVIAVLVFIGLGALYLDITDPVV
ncbi:MAG: site-2 protease family protein [Acidimicrobiia bacterium]|nr:site-2 protease family protein [Acidimicrobiia bacterium]